MQDVRGQRGMFGGLALWAGWILAACGGEVDVRVENPPGTGAVVALLFDAADAFADLRDPRMARILPAGASGPARFEGLAPGRYAVLVFHDANGNGELDRNFIGIPREPLGFSRRYWAKGEPAFAEAAVEVAEGERVPVEVELKKIFGRRGWIGVGVGAVAQSSPYRGADSTRVQPIPAITYVGERLQILGTLAQAGVATWPKVRLAATARYRLGAYEEEDSDDLEGMGDRKDSLFCGLALQGSLPAGMRISAGYEHDALDRVGGGFGRLALRRGFRFGKWSVSPSIGLNGLSAELARHEYGVEAEEARAGREAYRPGAALNVEPGLGIAAEAFGAWRFILNGSVEFLAKELRDSPLVDESAVVHAFGAANVAF